MIPRYRSQVWKFFHIQVGFPYLPRIVNAVDDEILVQFSFKKGRLSKPIVYQIQNVTPYESKFDENPVRTVEKSKRKRTRQNILKYESFWLIIGRDLINLYIIFIIIVINFYYSFFIFNYHLLTIIIILLLLIKY